MDPGFYRTSQFARKASVSVRTLRYYDKEGLLSPSWHSSSGHRLYSDENLITLQYILGLKFLGFSLQEIKLFLRSGPKYLQPILAQQKAMMLEKRAQIDDIIVAIEKTEQLMQSGECKWDDIVNVIQVIQMEKRDEWVQQYFTKEQLEKMKELSESSYSEEARKHLAERGEWTLADQKRVDEQYRWIASELKRLVAQGADPAGPEAQAVAKLQSDLIHQFTQGNPEVEKGLKNWWNKWNAMPETERPPTLPWGQEEQAFLNQAMEKFRSQS